MKQYLVNEERLRELLKAEAELEALSFGGVDNWSFYDESISDYEEDYGSIEEIVELELRGFKEI